MKQEQDIEVVVIRHFKEDTQDTDGLLRAFIRIILAKAEATEKDCTFDKET